MTTSATAMTAMVARLGSSSVNRNLSIMGTEYISWSPRQAKKIVQIAHAVPKRESLPHVRRHITARPKYGLVGSKVKPTISPRSLLV
jgi:hypothetical protein